MNGAGRFAEQRLMTESDGLRALYWLGNSELAGEVENAKKRIRIEIESKEN